MKNYNDQGDKPRFSDAATRYAGIMARIAGWNPDIFWRATPAEAAMTLRGWAEVEGGNEAQASMDRQALTHMMEQFPDG